MSNEPAGQKKNWFAEHKVITAVLVLLAFIVVAGSASSDDPTIIDNSGTSNATTQNSSTISVEPNEPMDLHTYSLTLLGSREATTLSSKYGDPRSAKPGTKFVIIDVEVTAQTTTEFTYFPDDTLELFDSKGRYFKEYNDIIGSIDNYMTVRTLSPSIPETGVLVYEIPETESIYALIGTNEQTGARYMVALPRK